MLTRYDDWPERLRAFLESKKRESFQFGTTDCALFACDAVQAMTGTDIAPFFRGRYDTLEGSLRALWDFSRGGLTETAEKIAAEFGMEEVPPRQAQRGDVVLIDNEGLGALGIVVGDRAAFAGDGITLKPMKLWRRAWRV